MPSRSPRPSRARPPRSTKDAGPPPGQKSLFGDEPKPSDLRPSAQPRAAASRPAPSVTTAPAGPALRAWVDGGARGNPGPAGYGAYVEDENGRVVGELSGFLGVTTNNVAEYRGLLAALELARRMNARSLVVHADSELVVKQMNGIYRVKHEKLRPLFLEARSLASLLPAFTIRHVRREQNQDADRLANEAMDRGI